MGSPQGEEFDAMETETTESTHEATENVDEASPVEMASSEAVMMQKDDVEESNAVSFFPPVYVQRYCRVRETLKDLLQSPKYKNWCLTTGKTVMEVGCAEFGMMQHFKSLLDITKVIFVDLDEELLEDKVRYLKPFPADYLQRITRPQPLVVEAYAGCVTKVDRALYERKPPIWAIVGIEIIEHLNADVLRGFEETVFGIIAPQIVIVTTPNSDFNEVFNLPPGKFRHWDHKFEWSRKEFQLWCDKIICEFDSYMYYIEGICEGSEKTRHLGCVSQMAVFEKRGESESKDISQFVSRIQSNAYKLIRKVEYPNYVETRTTEEIILLEFRYYLQNYIFSRALLNEYEESGMKEVKIPLFSVQRVGEIEKVTKGDIGILRDVLEKNCYKISVENGEFSVVLNIEEYVLANLNDSDENESNDSMDEVQMEDAICEDLKELDVNKVIESEDEWE